MPPSKMMTYTDAWSMLGRSRAQDNALIAKLCAEYKEKRMDRANYSITKLGVGGNHGWQSIQEILEAAHSEGVWGGRVEFENALESLRKADWSWKRLPQPKAGSVLERQMDAVKAALHLLETAVDLPVSGRRAS
jgi:hypothetical protein